MAGLPKNIGDVIQSDKLLGASPIWDESTDHHYLVFTQPLTILPIGVGGYQLRVKVARHWVDRDAVMQLEYAAAGKRSALPLWRLDWKPFHSHQNSGQPPDDPLGFFGGSHQHPFDDNYLELEDRMRFGNLPAARPFLSDPNTLSDFLAYGGELFRIKDISRINLPVSGPDIFWGPDD